MLSISYPSFKQYTVGMSDELEAGPGRFQAPVDAVLIIDGDNDPHIPPEFPVTNNTLVRVFLRPEGKVPRNLERKFSALPFFTHVNSTRGGANAADFVMSFHIGILHASLPMHIPFMLVTADKSLSVVAQELQRVGRQAALWTSHPERGARTRAAASEPKAASSRGRSRRGGRRGSRAASAAPVPAPVAASADLTDAMTLPEAESPLAAAAVVNAGGRDISVVAAAYASRLSRIKGPPSRLKTLLNDIKNRTANSGYTPDQVLEELKRLQRVTVDDKGKVTLSKGG